MMHATHPEQRNSGKAPLAREAGAGPLAARPRVSIVTPTFNRAPLLRETIDSILGQGFQDFEYLIIDDGSTDDTEALVRSYGDRITYRWHANVGEAASVNRGWEMACGDYLAVVSSDDPMLPGWLETAVAFMDSRPELIVAYPDWRIIDHESRTLSEVTTFDYAYRHMVGWLTTLPGPGTLIRRSALRDLRTLRDPSYRYAPDLECWLRLGLRGPFARIPHQLATWRSHPTSITVADRSLPRAREMVRLVDEFFARPDLPEDIRALRRFASSRAHWIASWVLQDTRPLRSALHLRRSYSLAAENPEGMPAALSRFPRPDRAAVWRAARRSIVQALGTARPARA